LDEVTGLVGFVNVELGALRVNGIAVRRTRDGRIALSFPTRRDRHGREHAVVLPVDRDDQREIERALIAELERQGALR
jgi:DNA-binding cell septation regulator SpoVG